MVLHVKQLYLSEGGRIKRHLAELLWEGYRRYYNMAGGLDVQLRHLKSWLVLLEVLIVSSISQIHGNGVEPFITWKTIPSEKKKKALVLG